MKSTYQPAPAQTACSLCGRDVPEGETIYIDPYLDEDDGVACLTCDEFTNP